MTYTILIFLIGVVVGALSAVGLLMLIGATCDDPVYCKARQAEALEADQVQ